MFRCHKLRQKRSKHVINMAERVRKRRVHDDLVEDIRRQIHEGVLRADGYLLPERELATKYGVSSRAVREGLARLEAEGLLGRHQGRGTVVLRPEPKAEAAPPPAVKNVAVIFQGRVRDTSTAEDFDGLQQAFQREGYGTTLYVADGSPEKETEIVERLVAEGVPGLVLYSAHPSSSYAHLQAARRAGMKIVVYDHDFPELDCNFVGIDDHLAAYDATKHLIRLGCRELVLINSERDWTTHVLRERGFEEAAADWGRGLPRRVIHIPPCETTAQLVERLREGLSPIMASAQRPLGVVAWWDEMALRAMECLRDAGWSIPDDAAVVGFANDQSGELADVPLTSMAIPREEIARLAASALVSQLRDPARQPQRIRLQSRMVIRESCGTYRRRGAEADQLPAAAAGDLAGDGGSDMSRERN
jgi:DNA-binding LacI/PurR family transcriptional regulator